MRSWAVFDGPIRQALHHLKYRRDLGLGDALARSMQFFVTGLHWDLDMVIPVPLSRQRLRERGYNQISLVAYPLAMQLGQKYSPKSLLRVKHTHSQVGLSREERIKNVSGAFAADRAIVAGRSILLMDDVSTTGSTIVAASEALKAAGADKVYALTLARAVIHHALEIA
jgi:ComF family protein